LVKVNRKARMGRNSQPWRDQNPCQDGC
jgi:hypothetical protein